MKLFGLEKLASVVAAILLLGSTAFAASRPDGAQRDSSAGKGVSIRNNILYDISGTPNLGIEIPLGRHFSIGANVGLKPWPRFFFWDWDQKGDTRKWRHFLLAPEVRFWPFGVYDRLFVGADIVWSHYNVGNVKFPFNMYPATVDSRLQGDWFGLGIFAGWSWWLTKRLRLEAEAGVAAGYSDAMQYDCAWCGSELGRKQGPVIVPKLGLNLAYNFRAREERQELLELIESPVDTLVRPAEVPPPADFNPLVPPVEEWKGVAGILEKTHPMLKHVSEYRPYTPDRILRKEEYPLYVFFELDKVRLLREFSEGDYHRDNGPVLDEIIDVTRSILSDTTSSVTKIQIVGLASVEGNLAHNVWLADQRALAMQKYIQERLGVPADMFETVGGGEAWTEFRDQINDLVLAGGTDRISKEELEWVRDVIDGESDLNRREAALKRRDGGKLYARILADVLHDQRNSGYVRVYYDYVPDASALEINKAIEAMAKGDYARALEILETKRDDPRSDNAYAVALFYNGREAEALQMLRKAAERGDDAARRNLMQLEDIARQRAEYDKYKSAMEEYNRLTAK